MELHTRVTSIACANNHRPRVESISVHTPLLNLTQYTHRVHCSISLQLHMWAMTSLSVV